MGYKCPVCDYTNKKWAGLRMHMLNKHKDEYPDGFPGKNEVEFVEDEEAAPRGKEVVATQFEDEDTNKLQELLLLHGVRQVVADRVSNLFDKLELYREPYNLSNLLKQSLSRQEQIAIVPILMELFPGQREQISGFMPVSPFETSYYRQPGAVGYPPMPSMENQRLNERIEKIESAIVGGNGKEDSDEIKALKLQLESKDKELQAEKDKRLEEAQKRRDEQVNELMRQLQQQNEKMPELIKEAYEQSNREHTLREEALSRGREEGLKAKSTDFENRVLDIVENQAAPAFIGEVREGRKIVQGVASKVQPASPTETNPEPISDAEASRISEILSIEEQMRTMAAGKHTEVPRASKEAVSEKSGNLA